MLNLFPVSLISNQLFHFVLAFWLHLYYTFFFCALLRPHRPKSPTARRFCVAAEKRRDTGAERRYQEIVQRRKLVDLAKAQAQEVAVLRAEVERLRMRTFPALVQVEHWWQSALKGLRDVSPAWGRRRWVLCWVVADWCWQDMGCVSTLHHCPGHLREASGLEKFARCSSALADFARSSHLIKS